MKIFIVYEFSFFSRKIQSGTADISEKKFWSDFMFIFFTSTLENKIWGLKIRF